MQCKDGSASILESHECCWQIWGEEALQFQEKLLNSSGLGDETYFPDSELLYLTSAACQWASAMACNELIGRWLQYACYFLRLQHADLHCLLRSAWSQVCKTDTHAACTC